MNIAEQRGRGMKYPHVDVAEGGEDGRDANAQGKDATPLYVECGVHPRKHLPPQDGILPAGALKHAALSGDHAMDAPLHGRNGQGRARPQEGVAGEQLDGEFIIVHKYILYYHQILIYIV
jgi:hypothetical protein